MTTYIRFAIVDTTLAGIRTQARQHLEALLSGSEILAEHIHRSTTDYDLTAETIDTSELDKPQTIIVRWHATVTAKIP